MLFARACIFGLLLVTLSTLAVAQNPNSAPKKKLVYLRTSIWDEKSHSFLKGLQADQFQIIADGKKASVEYFSEQEETGTIGMLVDLSASMSYEKRNPKWNEIPYYVNGFYSFLKSINLGNTYFINGFSDKSAELVDLTTDLSTVKKGLSELGLLKPTGETTSVFDAVSAGLTKLEPFDGKKILIVASDGHDNSSQISQKKLKKQLRESGVTVYLIDFLLQPESVPLPPMRATGGYYLDELVRDSGGRVLSPLKGSDLIDTFTLLGSYIRYQYVLGIAPPERKSGKWHKVEIALSSGLGNDVRTVAKTNYLY